MVAVALACPRLTRAQLSTTSDWTMCWKSPSACSAVTKTWRAFTWRKVSHSLSLQYANVLYLLEDLPQHRRLIRRYIEVAGYPDGHVELRADGTSLPPTVRKTPSLVETNFQTVYQTLPSSTFLTYEIHERCRRRMT